MSEEEQARFRLDIFAELEMLADKRGGALSRDEVLAFSIRGSTMQLVDYSRGIWNPQEFDATLSVVTATGGPYPDHVGEDGLLRYSYQGTDPYAGSNTKLRAAMRTRTPIIVFERPLPGLYVPVIGAIVVGEDVGGGHFIIATDSSAGHVYDLGDGATDIDKRYVAQAVKRRVHQPVFRAKVVSAYGSRCAICQLRHPELLDAAHIIPDSEPDGVPVIPNGLSLCKIHHAAYDQQLLGIDADYGIHINAELMHEVDGPMLKYGLQAMDGGALQLPSRPSHHPDRVRLDNRYARFLAR